MSVNDNPVDSPNDTTKLNNVDWRENIKNVAPEYVSEWDEFKNSDSPEKFFDQLKNHRSMLGQSIRIPSGEAGQEQREEFYSKLQSKVPDLMRTPDPDDPDQVRQVYQKLGLPESSDDYNIDSTDGLDPEALGAYRAAAHEAGLTKSQFKDFLGRIGEGTLQSRQQAEAAREEDLAGLRGEWGQAFEQRAGVCAKVAQRTGAPQNLSEAIQKGEADSQTMKWLYALSQQLGGEGNNFIDTNAPAVDAPAEIQGKINDVMANPSHPYWDSTHPQHKQALDKMMNWRRALAS
jgi:hypothetical protein